MTVAPRPIELPSVCDTPEQFVAIRFFGTDRARRALPAQFTAPVVSSLNVILRPVGGRKEPDSRVWRVYLFQTWKSDFVLYP